MLKNNDYGKFILLDQYGFKEIDKDIFLELAYSPRTDFIFFITSSFVKRFKKHQNIKRYVDTEKIDFDESQPKECHRIIANYYKSLIPENKEYYVHHFTIQKATNRGNYYGLIFGTNHTFGMEKFLKVCWNLDRFSGESNCNIDDDYENGTLFYNQASSNKKAQVREEIVEAIFAGQIGDNISGFKYTLKKGCEPSLFTDVIKELEIKGKIRRDGDLNYKSTAIHKAKTYKIQVCSDAHNQN
ncbi:three-Cys-motif partner protein TcmP [candidate division KSB1 bacterium]|nr:three-Cys-motif partner protein TcmP [candidate division KSB1 bacterium]